MDIAHTHETIDMISKLRERKAALYGLINELKGIDKSRVALDSDISMDYWARQFGVPKRIIPIAVKSAKSHDPSVVKEWLSFNYTD